MDLSRRRVVGLAGASLAGLAGCTGGQNGESTPTETQSDDPTPTATDTDTATETGTPDTSYSVTMAPVGTVTFKEPPQRVAHYFPGYADMAVALGHADSVTSIGLPSRFHTDHYEQLDGVSIDKASITKLIGESGISKEVFYNLDSDLHLIDPQWLINNGYFKLEAADIEEIAENVAPFIGNTIFRRTDAWHDYRYYSLYGAFEKVAKVYQETEKYRQLKSVHDDYLARVQAKLPSAQNRPNALLCWQGTDQPESFYPYRLTGKGTNKKPFNDLGIADALSGTGIEGLSTSDRGTFDYETMLQVDPDSILLRGHEDKSRAEFRNTVVEFMKNHDVASELTAVEEGRVFRGGPIYMGPLQHLFLLERYATAYFPDTFSGELFDRGAVADIVTA